MCIVYQAWDTRQQRFVAIKRLEPPLNEDPRTRARFDREGRALALLDHPNLVALLDRGSSENDDYLVFEYVDGRSLKELIREGHISAEAFGLLIGQVAEGLASAHEQGIVHRDVKPQNILIDRQGHAKVSDFGIATGPDWTRVTKAGAVIGSARYMSPEQIRSKPVDARSDIYSLGVVMYEMLTGHTPFDGHNMPEIARQHLQATPPPLTDARTPMPPGLDELVLRCLEKDPDDRFETMEELIGALVALGLYKIPSKVEETASHRWSLRRSQTAEEPGTGEASADHEELSASRSSRSRKSRGQRASERESSMDEILDMDDDDPQSARLRARDRARAAARKRRQAGRRRLMLGAGALVVLVVVIILTARSCGVDPTPELTGLTLNEATELASQAGLDVVSTEVPDFSEAGTVLSQSPMAGIKSETGSVELTVSRQPVPVQINFVRTADPDGDDVENDGLVGNLTDNDSGTSWSTESYAAPDFAGPFFPDKHGVGLEFSLADGATMLNIDYTLTGWSGELQALTSDDTAVAVAALGSSQQVTWTEPLTTGRIWFTTLAQLPDSDRYGVIINEISFWK